jgi:predicted RNA methylase
MFGLVAADYERYRMGYGRDVIDAVLAYAGRPVASALEVGAGTGKATRAFATRGIRVAALEPDPEMARLLEKATRGLEALRQVRAALPEEFEIDTTVQLCLARRV